MSLESIAPPAPIKILLTPEERATAVGLMPTDTVEHMHEWMALHMTLLREAYAPPCPQMKPKSWAYAMWEQETQLIKIGYSYHPLERRKSLQTQRKSTIDLVGAYPTGRPQQWEAWLHAVFFKDRIGRSEWFRPTGQIRAWIEAMMTEPLQWLTAASDCWHYEYEGSR